MAKKMTIAEDIAVTFDAAKKIALALEPATDRARERILRYVSDWVDDPDTAASDDQHKTLELVVDIFKELDG